MESFGPAGWVCYTLAMQPGMGYKLCDPGERFYYARQRITNVRLRDHADQENLQCLLMATAMILVCIPCINDTGCKLVLQSLVSYVDISVITRMPLGCKHWRE